MNRRRFFRAGLSELLKPLSNAIAPIEQLAKELGNLQSMVNAPPPGTQARAAAQAKPTTYLRPPGALVETEFLGTCTRSGDCVRACPAQAIKLDKEGKIAGGAPYIIASEMACVVCSYLACMTVCQSNALTITPIAQIKMGLAWVNHEICVRSQGQDCKICVEKCPLGTAAIDLVDGKVSVKDACIGCGVCEHDCPTSPKSIVVVPTKA